MTEDTDTESLRILLVGAPTAGKSDVAHKFAQLAMEAKLDNLAIIDNPVPKVASFGYDVGRESDFRSTLALTMEQVNQERKAIADGGNVLTIGGIVQRIAHTGALIEYLGERIKLMPHAENRRALTVQTMCGHTLSFILTEEFGYHYTFLLPLPPVSDSKLILSTTAAAGDEDRDEQHNYRVDLGLRQLFDAFFIPAVTLDPAGDPAKQMVDHIADSMKRELAEQAAAPVS